MNTKNLFSAFIMLFITFTEVLSQDSNFGIKAGVNYSTLSGNTGGETNNLPGFHVN